MAVPSVQSVGSLIAVDLAGVLADPAAWLKAHPGCQYPGLAFPIVMFVLYSVPMLLKAIRGALFVVAVPCFVFGFAFTLSPEGPYWDATAPLWIIGGLLLAIAALPLWR